MTRTPLQQAAQAIASAQNILVLTQGEPDGDRIASLLAVGRLLARANKKYSLVSHQAVPSTLHFLPDHTAITTQLSAPGQFVIALDVQKTAVDSLSYKIDNGTLRITLLPKTGQFDPATLRTEASFTYDLVITVNVPDLSSLVSAFPQATQLLHNTPIVALDHDSAHEHYGKINIVDLTVASTTTIIYQLFKEMDLAISDADTATILLTGIMSATESFQNYHTSPAALAMAAELYEVGGRQQEIVKNLFKTRELNTLNLWGRVLARLKTTGNGKLVWSLVSKEDFAKAEANHEQLFGVLHDLLSTVPGAEVFVVLYEHEGKIKGAIHAPRNMDALALAREFHSAEGHSDSAHFHVAAPDLQQAEKVVTEKILAQLPHSR